MEIMYFNKRPILIKRYSGHIRYFLRECELYSQSIIYLKDEAIPGQPERKTAGNLTCDLMSGLL